jgi:hypothetical protein
MEWCHCNLRLLAALLVTNARLIEQGNAVERIMESVYREISSYAGISRIRFQGFPFCRDCRCAPRISGRSTTPVTGVTIAQFGGRMCCIGHRSRRYSGAPPGNIQPGPKLATSTRRMTAMPGIFC